MEHQGRRGNQLFSSALCGSSTIIKSAALESDPGTSYCSETQKAEGEPGLKELDSSIAKGRMVHGNNAQ